MRWLSELSKYNFSITYRSEKQSRGCDILSRYALNFHKDNKYYTAFIDLSSITKTINAMKTVYTGNISSFTSVIESVLQNLEIKSVGLPKIEPKIKINDQKAYLIIGPVYEAVVKKVYQLESNLNSFSRKSTTLLRYWKQIKLNNKGILVKAIFKKQATVFTQKLPQYGLDNIRQMRNN